MDPIASSGSCPQSLTASKWFPRLWFGGAAFIAACIGLLRSGFRFEDFSEWRTWISCVAVVVVAGAVGLFAALVGYLALWAVSKAPTKANRCGNEAPRTRLVNG